MKTEIHITGQVMGNSRLRSAIITADCEEKRYGSGNYSLVFKSKKAAIKALSQGYQRFCSEMPEEKGRMSGFIYSRAYSLNWDASRAVIQDNN
jgi:hypothetical protein